MDIGGDDGLVLFVEEDEDDPSPAGILGMADVFDTGSGERIVEIAGETLQIIFRMAVDDLHFVE